MSTSWKKALKNTLIAAIVILIISIGLKLWLGKDIVLVPEILDFMFTGLGMFITFLILDKLGIEVDLEKIFDWFSGDGD